MTVKIFGMEVNPGEDFCDCCHVLYKSSALLEVRMLDEFGDMVPGFNVCAGCVGHCEQGPCYMTPQAEKPDPEKFRADFFAQVEQLRQTAPASEAETELLEDMVDVLDCYLSFFRDEIISLSEIDNM